MWDEQKRARFQALRRKEDEGTLSEPERTELAALIREIESAEMGARAASARREEAECIQLEAQNAALQALVRREESLLGKLRQALAEADAEQRAIEEEKARILGSGVAATSGRG